MGSEDTMVLTPDEIKEVLKEDAKEEEQEKDNDDEDS